MDDCIFMLAFDHRASFRKIFPVGTKPKLLAKRIAAAKMLVFKAVATAIRRGKLSRGQAAVLCDEEYGSNVLIAARKAGIAFALPVEKSGQEEFQFEYGRDFPKHITKFKPTYAKVLVRYNPDNAALNKRQLVRLKKLCSWTEKNGVQLLFELLVIPTAGQLAACGGSKAAFDNHLRPQLTAKSIEEIVKAGIEPAIWKLEGVDTAQQAKMVFGTARMLTPAARIIVLGRGETLERVKQWIDVGASTEGVVGFAVGRTIFSAPLEAYANGKIGSATAVGRMAATYATLIREFKANARNKR